MSASNDPVLWALNKTDGIGVDVVYDSIGKTTWDISLSVVKKLGLRESLTDDEKEETMELLKTYINEGNAYTGE